MPRHPSVTVVAALIESESGRADEGAPSGAGAKVFLAKRSAEAGHGGLWELPGGKVEAGESPEEALDREIREELGVELAIAGGPRRYEAEIEGRAFSFIVFPSRLSVPEGLRLRVHDEYRYFSVPELPWMELAPLDAPALRDWEAGLAARKNREAL